MKKKRLLITAFIFWLLSSSVIGAMFVSLGEANPWLGVDWVSPQANTKPPTLEITNQQGNRVFNSNNITLSLYAHVGYSDTATYMRLMKIYYKADWKQNETYVYNNEGIYIPFDENAISDFSYDIELTGVPEGSHYITVHAIEWGAYINNLFVHMFSINGSLPFYFTIDVSPIVSVLSLANKTYNISNVPLEFTVNGSYSSISYRLDEQDDVNINGNTTLTGLPDGTHKIIVYAMDEAGNLGFSETVFFTVEEPPKPFPATLVATASIVIVFVVVGIGLLVYTRKHKH